MVRERKIFHRDAGAWRDWRHITPPMDDARVNKMLMQMIHVLDPAVFHRTGYADKIENRFMLHIFAKAHPAGVRTDWHSEFRGE